MCRYLLLTHHPRNPGKNTLPCLQAPSKHPVTELSYASYLIQKNKDSMLITDITNYLHPEVREENNPHTGTGTKPLLLQL